MMQPSMTKDFVASIVAFLVALPLCMGIAIASGVPPALGLITGIIGGVVVGFLAGSPLQVSGPAAGLAVLVYELVQDHGLGALGPVMLLAGGVQLAAGWLKLGQWFRAISPSVIHGMLAGIGVLIFSSQFHVMVDDEPKGGGLANLFSIPEAIYKGVFPLDGDTHHLAAGIGLLTILTIVLWNRFRPAAVRMIPAALIAVLAASIAAWRLGLPIRRIEVPGNLLDAANVPGWSDLASIITPEYLLLGLVFAFIASAETLLCAVAVDQMHSGPRTNFDKELSAQGVGNMLCGVVGALPMTGVIVRSSANVQAGATTRRSAILHGVWLLLTVSALPWLLNYIPMAALAAILVYTGYKLVNIAQIRKIAGFGRAELGIYLATLIGIVATDLLTGVIIGVLLATAKQAYTFSHLEVRTEKQEGSNRVDIRLAGCATFLGLPKLAAELEQAPNGADIHVHIEDLDYIDHACLDLMANWEKQHRVMGGHLTIEWTELVNRYHRRANGETARQTSDREDAHGSTMAAMEKH